MELVVVRRIEDYIKSLGKKSSFTARARADNQRDATKLDSLPDYLKEDFKEFADSLVRWIGEKGLLNKAKSIEIDRLPDRSGIEGDVTDIRLNLGNSETISFSLKNLHNALKHPRLPRLPKQSGIYDSRIKHDYLAKRDSVWESFHAEAKKLKLGAKLFRELKALDRDFINKALYKPLTQMVIEFLQENANNAKSASAFFRFLTGHANFYCIKNEPGRILIKHFLDLPAPSSFTIERKNDGNFLMKFDNGWDVNFRLHTASSRMFTASGEFNKSTKFDVICINLEDVIKIEEEAKLHG